MSSTFRQYLRLNKFLAEAGMGSRRRVEELIFQGRVTVDGETAAGPGQRVDPERQKICVDGERLRPEKKVYYLVNKPKGYVSTTYDPSGRPRVLDLLPHVPQRIYTVGRLDKSSEGLMLVTNDGALADRLTHPRYGVEKKYLVHVAGKLSSRDLQRLRKGIWLAEGKVRPARLRVKGTRGKSTLLEMVLAEGRNREVRRMLARLGHKVLHLRRVAIDGLRLAGLKPGHARRLTAEELDMLRKAAKDVTADPRRR